MKTSLKVVLAAAVGGVPFAWAITALNPPVPEAPAADAAQRGASTRPAAAPHRRGAAPPSRHRPPVIAGAIDEPAPDPQPELSREEQIAQKIDNARREEQAFVDAFESQPVDSTWAHTWEGVLQARVDKDLAALDGFSAAAIECRSNKCLGTIAWDNYGAAGASLGKTVELTKGACATFSFMPPPEDAGARYTHKIRFADCRDDET